MVDGNTLWDADITGGMIRTKVSGDKSAVIFSDMPPTLFAALETTVLSFPEKTALVDDSGKAHSYGKFYEYCEAFAAYLYGVHKLKRGAHVGVMMHNTVEYCTAFLALSKIGAVMVALPSKFKKKEVLSLAEQADVELILCEEVYRGWFLERYPSESVISSVEDGTPTGFAHLYEGWESRAGDTVRARSLPPGAPGEEALIMFTSGTTSGSKGVLLKNYHIMHAIEVYRRILHVTEQDVSAIVTPIYHITGLVALLGLFIRAGGTLYLHKRFDAARVIRESIIHKFTFLHASPTVFSLLLKEGEHTPEIPCLVTLACGSGNMGRDKIFRLHRWLPKTQFHTVYGLTETSSPAAIFPGDAAVSPYVGAAGRPVPGMCFKIVDENRRELPQGSVGEIAVCGSNVLDSYYRQDTSELREHWLYTGDIGYFNEEQYLYIVDRKKHMINRGGEKIWCYDVENEMEGMEGIQGAAVVGIPDELYGEVAAAVVELKSGCSITAKEIQNYLVERMARYKIPVKIRTVENIPLTHNGKVDKVKVKEILMED